MKTTFEVQNFPTCLYRSKELKRVDKPNLSNTGAVLSYDESFYLNDKIVHTCRFSPLGFAPDSRLVRIELELDLAVLLAKIGIKIKPVSKKNAIMMSKQDIDDLRSVEYEFYTKNK